MHLHFTFVFIVQYLRSILFDIKKLPQSVFSFFIPNCTLVEVENQQINGYFKCPFIHIPDKYILCMESIQ